MTALDSQISDSIRRELSILWAAHARVGLKGKMRLYTIEGKEPLRSQQPGYAFPFGPEDIELALAEIAKHYNGGNLPNTPLLLDPIVYDEKGKALGSGFFWATALCLGIAQYDPTSKIRLDTLNVYSSTFHRGENKKAGLKIIGFVDKPLLPEKGVVPGSRAAYEVTSIDSAEYFSYYLLSGLSYLSRNGSFVHPGVDELFGERAPEAIIRETANVKQVQDAEICWNAYSRHHTLFDRFGVDVPNLERNLKYFNLCARDFKLFDATGPMRSSAEENFEFLVQGMIPRGSVTILAGAGGTGKSSAAHHLAMLTAIDHDKPPKWLGQPLNLDAADGLAIYFSGEDGPAILNARADLFDPKSTAHRLMYQRLDFGGEDVTIGDFLQELHKLPNVSLVVIDPARKYLTGNEDDSDVVSQFFEAIEEFAITKKSAMVVVHHLAKGAKPKSAAEVLDCLRGSQVFIDRARVVLGMYRDGPYTVVGLAKNNIPPNLGMVMEERVFARDPKTLELLWIPGEEGVRRDTLPPDELEELRKLLHGDGES